MRFKSVQRASSIDSLEQSESHVENLRFISGCHKWINSNERIRVENSYLFNDSIHPDETFSIIQNKSLVETDDEDSQTEFSLNHFDVQMQVNNGQLQQVIRYGVFSKRLPMDMNTFKSHQSSQTVQPEMDMDGGDNRRNGRSNNYSQQQNNSNGEGEGYRRNQQSNGSSGNSGDSADGDGSNPNRNNNNSKK